MSSTSEGIYLVGLGNPGSEYVGSRHNMGFSFVDTLATKLGLSWQSGGRGSWLGAYHKDGNSKDGNSRSLRLIKPQTYMNRSGGPLLEAIKYFKDLSFDRADLSKDNLLSLVVIHDELDFAPGVVKLKKGGGSGGHNGIKDISKCLSTEWFYRIRVGIGHPRDKLARDELESREMREGEVSDWVLSKPRANERAAIEEALSNCCERIVGSLADSKKNLGEILEKTIRNN